MNIQRTPPGHRLVSASGSGGGSTSNLSNYDEDENRVQRQPRKRKERTAEYDMKRDLADFRSEIMNFFRETTKAQNENIGHIHKEIQEIKQEIKTTTENLTAEYKQLHNAVENITSEHKITLGKIALIENDITQLKNAHSEKQLPKTSLQVQHDMVHEVQERLVREKNIIILGIAEKKDKSLVVRNNHDFEEVCKIISTVQQDCPKPIKTIRLGKYSDDKHRPVKIIFESIDTPRSLLKNRSKIPEPIKIYSDQTPTQRSFMQSLKVELKRREENGETALQIKYVKGIPTLIKKATESKN